MDELCALPSMLTNEFGQAQCCHLYLSATTMADICTSNGILICEWALTGQDYPLIIQFPFPSTVLTFKVHLEYMDLATMLTILWWILIKAQHTCPWTMGPWMHHPDLGQHH